MSENVARNTVLFDLDGTLLPLDVDFFLKHYLEEVGLYFKDYIDPPKMTKAIMAATEFMVSNLDPTMTNLETFASAFEPLVGRPWEDMWPQFISFYQKEFPKLRRFVASQSPAVEVVENLLNSGFNIVLATNPMFPECAIRERMAWCGVEKFPWQLVTTLEQMHFCKPNLDYYKEIVEITGINPKKAVMVGNDVKEDMVAKELGMKTFLVEDFVMNGQGDFVKPDGRGKLSDVPEFVINHLV